MASCSAVGVVVVGVEVVGEVWVGIVAAAGEEVEFAGLVVGNARVVAVEAVVAGGKVVGAGVTISWVTLAVGMVYFAEVVLQYTGWHVFLSHAPIGYAVAVTTAPDAAPLVFGISDQENLGYLVGVPRTLEDVGETAADWMSKRDARGRLVVPVRHWVVPYHAEASMVDGTEDFQVTVEPFHLVCHRGKVAMGTALLGPGGVNLEEHWR